MTTPTPEDRERALRWAECWSGPGANGPLVEFPTNETIASVILALDEEKRRLEELVAKLDKAIRYGGRCIEGEPHLSDCRLCDNTMLVAWARDALFQPKETTVETKQVPGTGKDADAKEVLEYIETELAVGASIADAVLRAVHVYDFAPKAEPEKFIPKVGERARLLASPDLRDRPYLGRVCKLLDEHGGCLPSNVNSYWHVEFLDDIGGGWHFHRDATWSRVDPVATEAKPAEAAGPTERLLSVMGNTVSEAANRAYVSWLESVRGRELVHQAETFFSGFEAGRASEAAAHEETKRVSKAMNWWPPENDAVLIYPNLLWENHTQASAGEVRKHAAAALQALDVREVPTREEIHRAVWEANHPGAPFENAHCCESTADAVFALLTTPAGGQRAVAPGVEETGHPQPTLMEQQRPISEVEANPWNYDAPPDSEIGQWHELKDSPDAEPSDKRMVFGRYLGDRWESDMGQKRCMLPGYSVEAWRRAQQAEPDLPARLTEAEMQQLGAEAREDTAAAMAEATALGKRLDAIAAKRYPGGDGPTKPLEERIAKLESKVAELDRRTVK